MNICVYSEQKSLLSVLVLHTFPAAGFQMTPCSLGWVYGALCETSGEYLWFGESDRRECRRLANVLSVYTWTLLHNTQRKSTRTCKKHTNSNITNLSCCMLQTVNILYSQLDNNCALAVIWLCKASLFGNLKFSWDPWITNLVCWNNQSWVLSSDSRQTDCQSLWHFTQKHKC